MLALTGPPEAALPGVHLLHDLRRHLLHNHVYIPWSVVVLSLIGSAWFALSSVLEQQAASDQPSELTLNPRLLISLLRHPRWLLGNVAGGLGFLFQLLALRTGSLALVQPIFVLGLALAIPGSAAMQRRWLTLREWATTGLIVAGLTLFIAVARPGHGSPHASLAAWLALLVITAVAVGGMVVLATGSDRRRALLLGSSAGVLLGSLAAVIERTGYELHHFGFVHALGTPWPYILLAGMVAALVVIQSAFQVGDLKHSLPALTVLEPVVAIAIGQLLFGEHIALGGLAPLGELAGLVAMTLGVVGLAGAPERARPPSASAPLAAASPGSAADG